MHAGLNIVERIKQTVTASRISKDNTTTRQPTFEATISVIMKHFETPETVETLKH
jgi:hypothetical protein